MLVTPNNDIDQSQTSKFPQKHKSIPLFHINTYSFIKNFDDLEHLLKCTNEILDIIISSETRITKQTPFTSNIST